MSTRTTLVCDECADTNDDHGSTLYLAQIRQEAHKNQGWSSPRTGRRTVDLCAACTAKRKERLDAEKKEFPYV